MTTEGTAGHPVKPVKMLGVETDGQIGKDGVVSNKEEKKDERCTLITLSYILKDAD